MLPSSHPSPSPSPSPKGLESLERESHKIVGMICSETVPEPEIQQAVASLRRSTLAAFPERPKLFDETFGRRFARLRTRFRPGAALFIPPAGDDVSDAPK